ncbi:GNS1/SUR4 membrane protein [Epithele typhae]|uniref:GNS1/SUR4 membrane protein n=1 Tax=Epithele typhae TaxID=378194 RepID=UPI00200747FF|nr:GNS1/SUR4 membrane protein [Epithele typhae]KAH9944374.1 GNS1/SUR4 membrane protein [Epithele typhae]
MASLSDLLLHRAGLGSLPVPYPLTHYVAGKTPLSTPQEVYPMLAAYLVTIFSIRAFMKNRSPLKLQFLFRVHNAFLSSGSLLLVLLIMEEVVPRYLKHGTFWVLCNDDMWSEKLEFYYMVNYYFKYIELIDTVFLALKKKPLAFLHVFHHSATALLCYTQLNGRTSVQWVPIAINLIVHVIMYYYYYATAGGAKIWWKKYLTTFQITQFIIDLFVVYFATYSYYVSNYFPSWPSFGSCAGTETAAIFGCVLLTSYLGLFIQFYIQTYKTGKRPVKANGVANGHG